MVDNSSMINRIVHQLLLPPQTQTRIDQHQLVTNRLANSASPNLVAAMAMIIQQMYAQLANPGMELAISTSFGPLKLAAKFKKGEWVGHDLTHPPTDDRVSDFVSFGHSHAPMHQYRTLYLFPRQHETPQPPTSQQPVLQPPPAFLQSSASIAPHKTVRYEPIQLLMAEQPLPNNSRFNL